jgi:hypothetical protein
MNAGMRDEKLLDEQEYSTPVGHLYAPSPTILSHQLTDSVVVIYSGCRLPLLSPPHYSSPNRLTPLILSTLGNRSITC